MPNGDDKNLVRLSVTVGAYRAASGEWPHTVGVVPLMLLHLAQHLGQERFERVCRRLRFETVHPDRAPEVFIAHGLHGCVEYGNAECSPADQDAAWQWLFEDGGREQSSSSGIGTFTRSSSSRSPAAER